MPCSTVRQSPSYITAVRVPYLIIAATTFVIFILQLGNATASDRPFDVVTFSNGDRLSGHLKTATSDSVTFSGVTTGEVTLRWTDIKQLSLASSEISVASTRNPNGVTVTGPVIEVTAKDLCITAQTGSPATVSIDRLIYISVLRPLSPPSTPQPAQAERTFKAVGGTLKISPDSVVRATQKQIQLAGAFDLGLITNSDEAFKHQATNIAMEANYSDSKKPGGSAVITELYSGTIQQNFYLTDTKRSCVNCTEVYKPEFPF